LGEDGGGRAKEGGILRRLDGRQSIPGWYVGNRKSLSEPSMNLKNRVGDLC